MGTDNLHHKRKERKAASLARKKAKRKPYDVALIVCEGAKTEPHYFEELRDALRLSTANIEIVGEECGSAPINVVDAAIKKYQENTDYDRVYCVFDKDTHPSYQKALQNVCPREANFMWLIRCHVLSIGCYCISSIRHNFFIQPESSLFVSK